MIVTRATRNSGMVKHSLDWRGCVIFKMLGLIKVRLKSRASWKDNAQDGFQPGDFILALFLIILFLLLISDSFRLNF